MSKKLLAIIFSMMVVLFIIYKNTETQNIPEKKATEQSESKKKKESNEASKDKEKENKLPKVNPNDFILRLVNYNHTFKDEELPAELVSINGYQILPEVLDPYNDMVAAAQKENINLVIVSAYRSVSYQQEVYNDSVQTKRNEGKTEQEANDETAEYVAKPGTSEHHTGLALDIVDSTWPIGEKGLIEDFYETKAGKWIDEHCVEYGFIIRFPRDKKDITKINYEPWHIRYVGVESAKYIKKNNLALEEYIELIK